MSICNVQDNIIFIEYSNKRIWYPNSKQTKYIKTINNSAINIKDLQYEIKELWKWFNPFNTTHDYDIVLKLLNTKVYFLNDTYSKIFDKLTSATYYDGNYSPYENIIMFP